jgi:hypothetical protein
MHKKFITLMTSVAAIWSYALPDAEIVALGVAGDPYQTGRE